MMIKDKFAILIPSCDNYSDVWEVLSESYKKFWNDCPFNIYIIANSEIKVPDNFIPINVGEDVDWSSNVIKALSFIKEDNIIMNIDDLILNGNIIRNKLYSILEKFYNNKWNYLKLISGNNNSNDFKVIELNKNDSYRTSTIFSVWNKNTLLDILKPGESPWQFEVDGTIRSMKYNKWFITTTSYITYENLIIKGVIENGAFNRLKKVGLIYKGNRKKMSLLKNVKHDLECFIYTLILKMPLGVKKTLIEGIRKLRK